MRAFIMLVIVSVTACAARETSAAVDAQFRRSFSIGLTVDQAIQRLDSLKIQHTAFRADSAIIGAIVRGVVKDVILRVDAKYTLSVDPAGKLKAIAVEKVATGA